SACIACECSVMSWRRASRLTRPASVAPSWIAPDRLTQGTHGAGRARPAALAVPAPASNAAVTSNPTARRPNRLDSMLPPIPPLADLSVSKQPWYCKLFELDLGTETGREKARRALR